MPVLPMCNVLRQIYICYNKGVCYRSTSLKSAILENEDAVDLLCVPFPPPPSNAFVHKGVAEDFKTALGVRNF